MCENPTPLAVGVSELNISHLEYETINKILNVYEYNLKIKDKFIYNEKEMR